VPVCAKRPLFAHGGNKKLVLVCKNDLKCTRRQQKISLGVQKRPQMHTAAKKISLGVQNDLYLHTAAAKS